MAISKYKNNEYEELANIMVQFGLLFYDGNHPSRNIANLL